MFCHLYGKLPFGEIIKIMFLGFTEGPPPLSKYYCCFFPDNYFHLLWKQTNTSFVEDNWVSTPGSHLFASFSREMGDLIFFLLKELCLKRWEQGTPEDLWIITWAERLEGEIWSREPSLNIFRYATWNQWRNQSNCQSMETPTGWAMWPSVPRRKQVVESILVKHYYVLLISA